MKFTNKGGLTSETHPPVAFDNCPAKSWTQEDGKVIPGRNVFNHCQIVGETARSLIERFPESIRFKLFPPGSELAAAAHDIGKVSPCFVAKIYRACGIDYRSMPQLVNANPDLEKQWSGHAGVSQATAEDLGAPKYVPQILGQHHGFSPKLGGRPGNSEVFGGNIWSQERKRLVDALKESLQIEWPNFSNAAQARVVAGLTSVADWIGSGSFFENPNDDWRPNIQAALDDAGFITTEIISGLTFSEVFAQSDQEMKPRPMQQLLIEQVTEPGIYILEAEMGMGKTEAALFAAYKMLEARKATGIYFALPTQLTSNKIYDRFNIFLERIVGPSTPNRSLLLHSGAWLLDQDMGEEGRPGGAWFNQSKRGLLAPFAVGTIDQALMAVMNVKHGFVRAFGLAGKVVILDEVHSYDLYTGTILNELIAFLRQIECTVIILSATLNQDRKQALLQQPVVGQCYPLISALGGASCEVTEVGAQSVDASPVHICLSRQDDVAIEEALKRAASGQLVLWIENTVVEAQKRYLELASLGVSAGCEVGLLHSQFTPEDRSRNEDHWVNLFGRGGWGHRADRGRLLVGTQVLEQSLDIDADFLISRFAPTDMLLQRIGRLWRHSETPRNLTANKECWILSPKLEYALQNPLQAFGLTAAVYSPYILCRSLETWESITQLAIPSSIRPLIDKTYSIRDESGQWANLLHKLKKGTRNRTGEEALQALATITLAAGGKTLPENKAETRYSDQDTNDVLLVRSIRTQSDTGVTRIRLLNGDTLELPHSRHKLSKSEWRKRAVLLNQQLIRIKPSDCPPAIARHELEKMGLQHVFYLGDPEWDEAVLRVALVTDTGQIQTLDNRPARDDIALEYRDDLGYRVISNKE